MPSHHHRGGTPRRTDSELAVEHEGAHVTWLADRRRRLGAATAARGTAEPSTPALVSVMWANDEVGTVLPIAEMSVVAINSACRCTGCHSAGTARRTSGPAAVGMSVAANKFAARQVRCCAAGAPPYAGGGQERDIRSGTDVASVEYTRADRGGPEENMLRDRLVEGVLAEMTMLLLRPAPMTDAASG